MKEGNFDLVIRLGLSKETLMLLLTTRGEAKCCREDVGGDEDMALSDGDGDVSF